MATKLVGSIRTPIIFDLSTISESSKAAKEFPLFKLVPLRFLFLLVMAILSSVVSRISLCSLLMRTSLHRIRTHWSPNRLQVGLCFIFGFQKQSAPKMTPLAHMESISGDLYIVGNIISLPFQCHWIESHIYSESTEIDKTRWWSESITVLHHLIWADGPYIVWEPIRGVSRGFHALILI